MRTILNFALIICILIVITAGSLVVLNMTPTADKELSREFVTVVMQKDYDATVELSDPQSIYAQMYASQQEKIARNKEMTPYREQKNQEKEDYIKRRENWVRYIDGELIKGYDPRFDDPFELNDLYYTGE